MKVYHSREAGEKLGLSHTGLIKLLKRSGLGFTLPLSEEELTMLQKYYINEKSK